MVAALVALGSNLGDRRQTLDQAVEKIAVCRGVSLLAASAWHATDPIGGPTGQGQFLNGAVLLDTSLSALQLFAVLQSIESAAGRDRAVRWGPRTLDLDLLLFGDEVIHSPQLIVPHPQMAFRRFVLEPAAEIASNLVHPTIGWSITRLLGHLRTAAPYVAIAGPHAADKTWLAREAAAAVGGIARQ